MARGVLLLVFATWALAAQNPAYQPQVGGVLQ